MAVLNYFTNRVYCNARYRELMTLLFQFLESNHYVVSDLNDRTRRISWADLSKRTDEASVIASPSRAIMNDYGGFVFRIVNLRRRCMTGNIEYDSLPIGVRQRFTLCPNYVELDGHRVIMATQEEISLQLTNWLEDRGQIGYSRTFAGEFLDLIESAYDDPAQKVAEIHDLVEELINTRDISNLQLSEIPSELIFLIEKLHPDSITCLATAELLRTQVPNLPDCSAAVIEYCKAIEIELYHKVLVPLRSGYRASELTIQPSPKSLKRLRFFIQNNGAQLELGTFAHLLSEALGLTSVDLAKDFVERVNALPFSSSKRLVKDIRYLTRRYRNPAAHKTVLNAKKMRQCKNFIVGSDKSPGLLLRIVDVQ